MSEPLPPLREELWELETDMRNTRILQAQRRREHTELTDVLRGRRFPNLRLRAIDRCPGCGEWRWNQTCPVRACWTHTPPERKAA